MTLGWSDGNTFLPLAFSLLSSQKEQNRLCDIDPSIDKRTNGYKRRKESVKKATVVLFDLLDQAKSYAIPAKYILFDSWFAYPKVIKRVLEYNLHAICMIKATPKVHYIYQSNKMNLKEIYAAVKKKHGKAKILASVIVELPDNQMTTSLQR